MAKPVPQAMQMHGRNGDGLGLDGGVVLEVEVRLWQGREGRREGVGEG